MSIQQIKSKMEQALEHFKTELRNIRTGRANAAMVEHVMVEIYGSMTQLKSVASISVPEARQILITPFDPKNSALICKAIEKANLGFNPVAEGNSIRIKIPPMTEETRKKMVKVCYEECEKAKISIRTIRRAENDLVRKQKSDGLLPEDQMKKLEKQIQELTDNYCHQIDELTKKREQEVLAI